MELPQAEAFAEALSTVALDQVATKSDLRDQEQRILLKVGGMIAASSALTITILGALIKLR